MSTTLTQNTTPQNELDRANPNTMADILRLMKLGTMLTPLKRVFTGLTAAAAFDLTAIDATGETTGPSNPNRLAALSVTTLRVVTGATVGPRVVTDAGGTPGAPGASGPGITTLSDDGKTLTFEAATVTAFTIEYIPRAQVVMTTSEEGVGGAP